MTLIALPSFRRAVVVLAAALVLAPSAAFAASPPISGSGTGSIIAEAATSPIALAAGSHPGDVVFSADGTLAYVAAGGIPDISIIDVATNTQTSTIPLATAAASLVLSSDGQWLYAMGGAGVFKVDTTSLAVTTFPIANSPSRALVTPDGLRVYAVSTTTVEVIDAITGAAVTTLTPGFINGNSIAVSPDGTRVYVGSLQDDTITVIDTATNTVVSTITTAGPYPVGFAFSRDASKLYVVTQGTNSVAIVSTATNAVLLTAIPVGVTPNTIVVSPNGLYAYVTGSSFDDLTVVDLATNVPIATLQAGDGPVGAAVSPDGTRIFETNYTDDTVTAFDVTELAFSGQGEMAPGDPASFALTLTNGDSPIANYQAGSAVAELVDSGGTVVATGPGVSPNAAGTATATVPTSGLAPGVYSVRITFTDANGVVVAQAAGFTVTAPALAATGSDPAGLTAVAALLLVGGTVVLLIRPGIGRRRATASGRRTSRAGSRG
jgi:YVTN family beta-propeller protein